jgi:HlyD family secretion protein
MKALIHRWKKVVAGVSGLALATVVLLIVVLSANRAGEARAENGHEGHGGAEPPVVTVVKAEPGGIERTTTQPGTLRAFEHVELYAKVPGYLKGQDVDIGSEVKRGQILARIDAPELEKDKDHALAALAHARAQKLQMQAHLTAAKADLETAKLVIGQREAEARRAASNLRYRLKAFERVQTLLKQSSVSARLVDEEYDRKDAARAWKDAAELGVGTARADVKTKEAKVAGAEADLKAAVANIDVAQAALERAEIFVGFTEIRSKLNGLVVVTERNYHNGDYIRPGDRGAQRPLLVLQRRDKMRLIVLVPDADVPYCNPGDPVTFSIGTLPAEENKEFLSGRYKVSRISYSQSQKSRTMRVEVDVPNPKRILRDGMYGEVTIHLEPARKDAVHVPSSALRRVEEQGHKRVHLYVVREGKARRLEVRLGTDNGNIAEVLTGGPAADQLRAGEVVIDHPGCDLQDGSPVHTVARQQGPAPAPAH